MQVFFVFKGLEVTLSTFFQTLNGSFQKEANHLKHRLAGGFSLFEYLRGSLLTCDLSVVSMTTEQTISADEDGEMVERPGKSRFTICYITILYVYELVRPYVHRSAHFPLILSSRLPLYMFTSLHEMDFCILFTVTCV